MSSDLDRCRASLKSIFKDIYNASVVEIGWDKTKVYAKTGIPVASIAALNEWGGLIYHPPGEQTIYRAINEETGVFLRNARFVKLRFSNYATTHVSKGYWQMIPMRPFFRTMIAAERDGIADTIVKEMEHSGHNAKKILDAVGLDLTEKLRDSILAFNNPANAASTIRKKGFDDPLIHSSQMMKDANYESK